MLSSTFLLCLILVYTEGGEKLFRWSFHLFLSGYLVGTNHFDRIVFLNMRVFLEQIS